MTPSTRPQSAPDLQQPELAALRDNYRQAKAKQIELLKNPSLGRRSVQGVLHYLSQLADNLLQTLWQRAQLPDSMALVAVGGYGRAQLFPYSDIDVLLLMPLDGAPAPEWTARIEHFISSCWDSGLEIGSSVTLLQSV